MGRRANDRVPYAAVGAEKQYDPYDSESHADIFPWRKDQRKSYRHRQNADLKPASVLTAFPVAPVNRYAYQEVRYRIARSGYQYDVAGKAESQAAYIGEVIRKVAREDIPRKQRSHSVAGRPCEFIFEWNCTFLGHFFFNQVFPYLYFAQCHLIIC